VARYLCRGMELRKEGNRPVRQAPGWRRLATARVHATRNGRLGHACSSLRGMAAPHGVTTGGVVVSERVSDAQQRAAGGMAGESRGQSTAEGREGWPDRNGERKWQQPAGVFGSGKAVAAVADARTGHERAPRLAAERNFGRRAARCGQDTEGTGRDVRWGWVGWPGPSSDGRSAARQTGGAVLGDQGPGTVNGSGWQEAGGDPRTATSTGPWSLAAGPNADSNYRSSTNITLSFENGRK